MGAPRELELELCDEVEGEEDGTTDFVFRLAGDPIPLLPTDSNPLPLFDLLSPPARPLVVSDRHATVFLAHPSGFIAVRTKELIEASKEAREKGKASTRCAQDCCVADVPLPGVSLIALSHDESVLAACTDTEIQFFSLASLLTHKDVVPSSSCSLGRAGTVKDFKWLNHASAAYIVLSNGGLLCHGSLGEGLKDVMENVDAVGCCKEGNHIAVARGNKLTILSPDFKETCSISLLFQLWSDESDSEGTTIKVDSIGWVHGDSIVIGCVRLNEDHNEEGYLVQVIRTEESTFCESPDKPDVYTYVDFFHGIMDDVLPSGVGPNMLFGYLHRWDLMVASNKKSIEDHIALLKWPSTHDDEITYLEMLEDKYSPRIELQENGDDNIILGFGVENVSLFQKITVTVGPEHTEVAPQHILLCLTAEGKVAVYYIARISDPSDLPHAIVSTYEDYGEKHISSATLSEKELTPRVTNLVSKSTLTEHGAEPSRAQIGKWLGYAGEILVLFETPSGFAIFCYDGTRLFLPNAIQKIWADFAKDHIAKHIVMLREFQTFEDKANAIKLTGVDDQLAKMIKKWLLPNQKLAVGKLEYKTCIEANLRISCIFEDTVMELMWGLNYLVKSLIPEEKLELTKEDRLPMSKGMIIFLERNGFAVKPQMVNSSIIEMAYALYECDLCENKNAQSLQGVVDLIKRVSDIDCNDWDCLKVVSAVKIICYPKTQDSKMFSEDELSKLLALAPSLAGQFYVNTCLEIYKNIVFARGIRDEARRRLKFLVEEGEQSDLIEKISASVLSEKTKPERV